MIWLVVLLLVIAISLLNAIEKKLKEILTAINDHRSNQLTGQLLGLDPPSNSQDSIVKAIEEMQSDTGFKVDDIGGDIKEELSEIKMILKNEFGDFLETDSGEADSRHSDICERLDRIADALKERG